MNTLNGLVNNGTKATAITSVTEAKAEAKTCKGYGETVETLLKKHPKGLLTVKMTVSTKSVREVDETKDRGQMITGVHPGKLSYSFDKKDRDIIRYFLSLSLNPIKVKKEKNKIGGYNSIYHFNEDGPIFVKASEGLWVAKVKTEATLNEEEKNLITMLKQLLSWEEALPKLETVKMDITLAKAFWEGSYQETSTWKEERMKPSSLASALMGGIKGAKRGNQYPVKVNINSTNRTGDWWRSFHNTILEESVNGNQDAYILTLYFPATRLKAGSNPKGMVRKEDGLNVDVINPNTGEIQKEFQVNWGGGAMPLLRMEWEKGSLWTPDLSNFFSEKETQKILEYAAEAYSKETEKETGMEDNPELLIQLILAGGNGNRWPEKFGLLPNKKKKETTCDMWEEWDQNPEYWEEVLNAIKGKKKALAFFTFSKFEEVQAEYLIACAEAKKCLHEQNWLEQRNAVQGLDVKGKPLTEEPKVEEETPKPEPKPEVEKEKEETPDPMIPDFSLEIEEVKEETPDPVTLHSEEDLEENFLDNIELMFEEDEDLI